MGKRGKAKKKYAVTLIDYGGQSDSELAYNRNHKINVQPKENGSTDNSLDAASTLEHPAVSITRSSSYRDDSTNDIPQVDCGVRMLCMDGGGAKGVIEATILDKIFVTVACTLKYEKHVINWITIVIDKDVKDKSNKTEQERIDSVLECLVDAVNHDRIVTMGGTPIYSKVQTIDRTYVFNSNKICIIVSGFVDKDGLYYPMTYRQKASIFRHPQIRKQPGLELKDFLHGASKYWVFLESDHSNETREQLNTKLSSAFDVESKCVKLLIPASSLILKKNSERCDALKNRDLFLFYWDLPVHTEQSIEILHKLLGKDDEEHQSTLKPTVFMNELRAHELFDLLIGTSTGSILAFGMGYKGLSPQECRDVYLRTIKKIFSSKYDRSTTGGLGLGDSVFRLVGDLVGQGHYTINGVKDTLEHEYNESWNKTERCLMGQGDYRSQCICACVALNWEKQNLDTFDTHNKKYKDWDLVQFLTASSDAPVYFTTPFEVKANNDIPGTKYIDGGLGANCPAKQGIELAKKRWKNSNIELILSLGAGKDRNPPEVPKTGGEWLKTLVSMVTDGDRIWHDFVQPMLSIDEACKTTEALRIQPRLELAQFKADSTKVIEMCQIAEAWLNTCTGFEEVCRATNMIIAKNFRLSVESRILTEKDLLDWIVNSFTGGLGSVTKSNPSFDPENADDHRIMNDSLDMKFGREIHTLFIAPSSKIGSRFPAIDNNFIFIPKAVSVGQTDLRFTVKFSHEIEPMYDEKENYGKRILKLHCPDNHKVRIIGHIDINDSDNVYKVSQLVTVPLEETEQFHRLVHEASKEISQLPREDLLSGEDKLVKALNIMDHPAYAEIQEKYSEENFMRIQACFYLWKRTADTVSLHDLNDMLIEVGMKKRPWPRRGRLGDPDVTVRTVIPAPPENMMSDIAIEYFKACKRKAEKTRRKADIDRYNIYLSLLQPVIKQDPRTSYKSKFIGTVFKKDSKDAKKEGAAVPGKKKLSRTVSNDDRKSGNFFRKTKKFFKDRQGVPKQLKTSPYGRVEDVITNGATPKPQKKVFDPVT